MPPEAARILDEMQSGNRLEILKGRLQNIDASGSEKFTIYYSSNGSQTNLSADALINCIGSESKFDRLESALVKNLTVKKSSKTTR